MEGRPPDDREKRERRAEDLRRRIEELVGDERGERASPRTPHEFIEERMREEAERLRREREADERAEDNGEGQEQ
jgi:hypothetical protein